MTNLSTVTENRGSSLVDALRRLAFTIDFLQVFEEHYKLWYFTFYNERCKGLINIVGHDLPPESVKRSHPLTIEPIIPFKNIFLRFY